ncbi:MAG: translation initiation factor IF-2 [Spirochaetota bacterium]
MKAEEIAKKNLIKIEDILSICKDLDITCNGGESELSDQDAFLVEKKIETIKKVRAKEAEDKLKKKSAEPKKKKIKLKRKLHLKASDHVKSEIKKHTEDGAQEIKKAAAPASADRGGKPSAEGARKRPAAEGTGDRSRQQGARRTTMRPTGKGEQADRGAGRDRTPSRDFPKGAQHKGAPAAKGGGPSTPASELAAGKETSRKKGNKDRDKAREDWKKKKTERKERETDVQKLSQKKHRIPQKKEAVTPESIEITENIAVGDLAKKLNVKANEVIAKLMKLGVMATINQVLDADTAEILASEYNTAVKVVSLYDETVIRDEEVDHDEDKVTRSPIVTVMGHVDHGKTKLLDTIRNANVTEGEFGGITQHIGAYQVKVHDHTVTFLDTPGHAAFTTMRARGAKVTDIVVLVVAANDGVMPQTVEAINHAKEAGVPIIVAINKIDLPEANVDKVRQELASYNLVPEAWGGDTLYAEISAKQNINIDGLLELILMQSEILELRANPKVKAKGTVIEAKLDPGRGSVASLLVQKGTLHVGDSFVVGIYAGKIRAMFDDKGKQIESAGPAVPVEILGLDGIPSAGDPFEVVDSEKYSKQIAGKRQELKRIESAKQIKKVTLEDLNEMISAGEVQDVRIIIKADVDGSVQALKDALEKLSTSEVKVKVIHASAGGINESDVMLASASNALIIGYHVRPTPKISEVAEQEKVSIKTYNIIFEVTKDVKDAMEGMLKPDIEEQVTGSAEVKQIFKVSKIGTIAGCVVVQGSVHRNNRMRLIRDGVVIFDGNLSSLKRYKDDVNTVEVGQECGIGLEKFNDIKEGDFFESYRLVEVAKKLGD